MTWNLQGTKKTLTRHHINEATALAQHPEAVRVPHLDERNTRGRP